MKRPDAAAISLLPQTEQEYWNITLDNRNRRYVEELKQVNSLLEELMLGTEGYEWLGEVVTRNRNGAKYFGNLQNTYDEPGEHLKPVAEANQVLENIHYKNETIVVTFEVCATKIKDSYKILKDHGEVHNDSQKVQKFIRGMLSDAHAYLYTAVRNVIDGHSPEK